MSGQAYFSGYTVDFFIFLSIIFLAEKNPGFQFLNNFLNNFLDKSASIH